MTTYDLRFTVRPDDEGAWRLTRDGESVMDFYDTDLDRPHEAKAR